MICGSRICAVAGGAPRWATKPQQTPSAGTRIWSWFSGARTRPICRGRQRVAGGDYKGKEAARLVMRSAPAWFRRSPNCATSRRATEELDQWKTGVEERKSLGASAGGNQTGCVPW